jgi:hypothetical protein
MGKRDEMPHIELPTRGPEVDGEYLRGWRVCERLGLGEAARLAGLTTVELSEMERGKRPFELHAVIERIKAARRLDSNAGGER